MYRKERIMYTIYLDTQNYGFECSVLCSPREFLIWSWDPENYYVLFLPACMCLDTCLKCKNLSVSCASILCICMFFMVCFCLLFLSYALWTLLFNNLHDVEVSNHEWMKSISHVLCCRIHDDHYHCSYGFVGEECIWIWL